MKRLISLFAICMTLLFVDVTPARSQTREIEGYTFIGGTAESQVCLGRWVPSKDVALPGYCDGQIIGAAQLAALSARQTSDKLDKLLSSLASIDQRIALGNEQVSQLLTVNVETQRSIDRQVRQVGELLRGTIAKRFDALPEEILSDELFKEELSRLKEDVLKEVEKHYLKQQPAPAKK